jgi:hypothetical protein
MKRTASSQAKKMSILVGRRALEDAFKELVGFVDVLVNAQADLAKVHAPIFTYIMSPKQKSQLDEVCERNGWEKPMRYTIEINALAIAHVLKARQQKDNVPVAFIGEILAAAYNDFSIVRANKAHSEQALFLNPPRKLQFRGTAWYAVAIVAIDGKEETGKRKLKSRTAYHANEAKMRAMEKAPKASRGKKK